MEKFIPFHTSELYELLESKIINTEDKSNFKKFCGIIEAIYHFNNHKLLIEMKNRYISIDPDSENFIKPIKNHSDEEIEKKEKLLVDGLKDILKMGNYIEIGQKELEMAFEGTSPVGINLEIDFDKYSDYLIFYRGKYKDSYEKKLLWRKKKIDFDVYGRIVFMFKMKKVKQNGKSSLTNDKIYLKYFKNVPEMDLEMIFPDAKVQIKLIDKLQVVIPILLGLGSSAYKMTKYFVSSNHEVALWKQISFWVFIAGLFGFGIKSYLGFKNTIEKYLKNLTTSLYFQNLDNNSGVFKSLIDDAEEQECKEIILAYFFLLQGKNKNFNEEKLDEEVENFFKEELDTKLDFEVDDAVRKLRDRGLLKEKDGILNVLPLDEALSKLSDEWSQYHVFE